jgi:molecular chaperone HtpG
MTKHTFQSEVSQLLHLIIHSLYSHKEIFLRELISNASDALDRLKYLTLTEEAYKNIEFDPRIDISYEDGTTKTLTVADTGIGMNAQELVENLGTIARSGTRNFLKHLTGDARKDANLIGQFGVGFYSSFMVAERVEVISRKAGEEQAYRWTSDGRAEFQVEPAERDSHGTSVTLTLNEEGKAYVDRWEIQNIVRKYSNHIPFPIFLHYEETQYDKEGKEKGKKPRTEQINIASAFWKRPKSQLKDKDYKEFYKTFTNDYEDPLLWIHTQAEGTLDYTTLFYVPRKAPYDLYFPDYRPGVKLYVKRVFITDEDKDLMPGYLRFIRGIIDSEDLPLNVSREMLQQNRILAKIKANSVKKILNEFLDLAQDSKRYLKFYEQYSRPLKEGLYQDHDQRDTLLKLMRFKSTKVDGYTSFADYVSRMPADQKAIYYITGDNEAALRRSPLLEMYRQKGIEVLIMDDEIDELVFPVVAKYEDHPLKAVNRSDAVDDLKTEEDRASEKDLKPLVGRIKKVLRDRVKDVRVSSRLSDSPACVVADAEDPTVQMQELLKVMGQTTLPEIKPILEINPRHAIVKKLADMKKTKAFDDACWLLLDQALLLEGVKPANPADFVKRLNTVLEKAL